MVWQKTMKHILFFLGICLLTTLPAKAFAFLGEKPTQVLRIGPKRTCHRFQRYTIVEAKGWFMVKRGNSPRLCHKGKAKLYIKATESTSLRGFAAPYVFIAKEIGSDYFDLMIYSLQTKGVIWQREAMAPNASLAYNPSLRALRFMAEVKPPAACAKPFGYSKFNAMMRACWKQTQRKYPSLRGVPAPRCDCKGLVPYVSMQHT
ncbi:MAG: hypothetical protein H6728_13495, partial [Myxococcales bacterium]|nr:hypothetical protein [Myxococcales bacterium]